MRLKAIVNFIVVLRQAAGAGADDVLVLNLHNLYLGFHIFPFHSCILHSLLDYDLLTIHDVQALLRGLSYALTSEVIDVRTINHEL